MNPNELKIVYKFDEYGYYVGESLAQYDPIDGGLLLPEDCVEVAPVKTYENSYFVISEDRTGWQECPYPNSAEELVGIFIPHEVHCEYAETIRRLMKEFTENNPDYQIVRDETDLTLTVEKIEKTNEETEYEEFQTKVTEFQETLSSLKDDMMIALLSDNQDAITKLKEEYKELISQMETEIETTTSETEEV